MFDSWLTLTRHTDKLSFVRVMNNDLRGLGLKEMRGCGRAWGREGCDDSFRAVAVGKYMEHPSSRWSRATTVTEACFTNTVSISGSGVSYFAVLLIHYWTRRIDAGQSQWTRVSSKVNLQRHWNQFLNFSHAGGGGVRTDLGVSSTAACMLFSDDKCGGYERSRGLGRSKIVPVDANASGCNRDSWMSLRIKEIPSRDWWKKLWQMYQIIVWLGMRYYHTFSRWLLNLITPRLSILFARPQPKRETTRASLHCSVFL